MFYKKYLMLLHDLSQINCKIIFFLIYFLVKQLKKQKKEAKEDKKLIASCERL